MFRLPTPHFELVSTVVDIFSGMALPHTHGDKSLRGGELFLHITHLRSPFHLCLTADAESFGSWW